jgi:uncharacterized membrane protein YphA (DoxX/SURF4 family)
MGAISVSRLLFAVGFMVVGAIGLGAHDFVLSQQPVPAGIPSREALACISGALLLLSGMALLIPRTARLAALVLAAYLSLWVLALQLPRALGSPRVMGFWLGVGEDLTLATGSWLIYCAISGRKDETLRMARVLFGLALVPIGLSHFVYLQITADFIPPWFPARGFLAGLTGAAHIAAGLAIVVGVVPRLAATLEAVMQTLFTLIVWVTAVIGAPGKREDWVNLFISTALSAAAWAVAESYRLQPWSFSRRAASNVAAAAPASSQ